MAGRWIIVSFRKFKRIALWLWLALAVGAVVVILARGGNELVKHPIQLNIWFVFLSVLISWSGLIIGIVVWRQLLASFGLCHSFRDDVRIYCYSALGVALPGGIWSIVGRSFLYQRQQTSGSHVATASVIETLLTGIAGMAVYGLSVAIRPGNALWRQPLVGILCTIGALILINPHVFNAISLWIFKRFKKQDQAVIVNFRIGELLRWIALEILVISIGGLALYVLLSSLTPAPLPLLFQVSAAWGASIATSNLLFWFPGTAVLRDSVMVIALTPGLPLSIAIIFVVLVRVWSMLSLLLTAGLVWLLLKERSINPNGLLC